MVRRRFCSASPTSDNHSRECPVCSPPVTQLAARLPVCNRVFSRLRCRMSGDIMDERNPPIALPNGMVYSKNVRRLLLLEVFARRWPGFSPCLLCPEYRLCRGWRWRTTVW